MSNGSFCIANKCPIQVEYDHQDSHSAADTKAVPMGVVVTDELDSLTGCSVGTFHHDTFD